MANYYDPRIGELTQWAIALRLKRDNNTTFRSLLFKRKAWSLFTVCKYSRRNAYQSVIMMYLCTYRRGVTLVNFTSLNPGTGPACRRGLWALPWYMPGHFSPPEANFYCTIVLFLLAEVSFSFISYVGIATLCCLRYWGAPPQRGPSPDCLSCGSNCTNDQRSTSTMDNGPVPQSPALDKTRNRHATCHPVSLFRTFLLLRPCQRTHHCTACRRRWLRTVIGQLSSRTTATR